MLLISLLSLVAGVLTVLTPCALPLLPIIVGGSVTHDRRRPFIVTASLLVSVLAFTWLLKASTLLISIPPTFWQIFSGALIVSLGLSMLMPSIWTWISTKLGWEATSGTWLARAHTRGNREAGSNSATSAILTGVALGPVFSSCSPTYAWVLATVLPSRPAAGLFYLALYCVGLAGALLLIALAGHSLIRKLGWAANPRGWFQRGVAIVFILVGALVLTGVDRSVQTWAVGNLPGVSRIEQGLLPDQVPAPGTIGEDDADVLDGTGEVVFNASVPAPEITGITHWLNSDPLTLQKLRGKVVLIDFWTYSCVNCIRTQPVLNSWYERYHQEGFEIIGVHAPEFAFEKLPENVQAAIDEEKIKYPVALDNDFATWNAFQNQYWPAKYLIDKNGTIRYYHFGEGNYEETETAIRKLLGAEGKPAKAVEVDTGSAGQSPETYLGVRRASGFKGSPSLGTGVQDYQGANELGEANWTLSGKWEVNEEKSTAKEDGATLTYRFTGKKVFLVLGGQPGAKLKVTLDEGEPGGSDVKGGEVTIDRYRLYNLVDLGQFGTGTLTITFPAGVSAHAFTFG